MYVYLHTSPGVWTVGFFAPAIGGADAVFVAESDHGSADHAAVRVRWLNGGSVGVGELSRGAALRVDPAVNLPGAAVAGLVLGQVAGGGGG